MHLLSEFTVLTLQHLQPFLLGLGSCDLVPSAVLDVLSPVGVGSQGERLVLECNRVLSLEVEDFFIVEGDVLVPYSCNFTVLSYSVLLIWLFPLPADELFHELGLYLPNSSLEVICWLLLLSY
jgi:hypothetical protein